MKKNSAMVLILMAFFLLGGGVSSAKEQPVNCQPIKNIFPANTKTENGLCKVDIDRDNLSVSYRGDKVSQEMLELSFIATFEKIGLQTVVMGEFALLQDEINPVIDALRQGGLNVSAVHNHWIEESPRIMYLHFQGIGDPAKLAQTVKTAITRVQSIKSN